MKIASMPGLIPSIEKDDDKLRVEPPSFSALSDATIRNPGRMPARSHFMHMAPAPPEISKPTLQGQTAHTLRSLKIEGIN